MSECTCCENPFGKKYPMYDLRCPVPEHAAEGETQINRLLHDLWPDKYPKPRDDKEGDGW